MGAAKYRGTSPNACYGRGACDADSGECSCEGQNYFGDACQFSSCGAGMGAKADQCSGKGACNTLTGLCSCNAGALAVAASKALDAKTAITEAVKPTATATTATV